MPKLNIPRSVHPGIAVKINGSPTVHIHLVLEDFVSFTIPVNRTQRCFSSCIHLLGDLAPGLLLKDKEESQPEEIGLNSSLKFLSPAHISFLYFIFPSPSLSSPSSFLLLLLFLSLSLEKKKLRRSSCKEENSNFVGNNIVTRYFRKASEKTVSSPIVFYGSLTLMRNRPPTASEQILLSVVKSDLKMQQ